jgi:hypothetical protein
MVAGATDSKGGVTPALARAWLEPGLLVGWGVSAPALGIGGLVAHEAPTTAASSAALIRVEKRGGATGISRSVHHFRRSLK